MEIRARSLRQVYAARMKSFPLLASVFVSLFCLAACGQSEPKAPRTPAGPLVSSATPSAATLEKLAAADRLDGTEDKVISFCPSCGLRMRGNAEFSCRIGAYTTHSCAAHCNESVCEDPDGIFADIQIPAK